MANTYILAASTSSDNIQIFTDKVRIATTNAAVSFNVGNANTVTASITDANVTASTLGFSGIVPQNSVERTVLVGQGNYLAYVASAATLISITELGAPHANFAGQ